MKKKTIVLCALIALRGVPMASAGDHPRGELQTDRIKIGVSTALTGNAASYGIDLKNTIIFANEKLAADRYDLIIEDDRCSGRDAASVAQRFVNVLHLKYVAGFACSSTVLSTAKVYNNAGAVAMVMSASAADISKVGVFRTAPSDRDAARALYAYLVSKHKNIGVLSEQTDFAQGFLRSLAENNNDNSLMFHNENYFTDALDFRSMLIKLKGKNIDGLFINSQTEVTFLAALKQVKEMKISLPLFGAYWPGSPAFLEKAGTMGEGVIFVDWPSVRDLVSDDGLILFREFESKFGRMNSVESLFVTGYEGFRALHQAILSGQDARAYLHSTKFHGLIGDWSFDKNGDIEGLSFVMKVVRGGKAERL